MKKNHKFKKIVFSVVALMVIVTGCATIDGNLEFFDEDQKILNKSGEYVLYRYNTPQNYARTEYDHDSYATFIRHKKLKPYGEKVKLYNGNEVKSKGIYDSVYDMDLQGKDIFYSEDAIVKFRADYLYSHKKYKKMTYTLKNGVYVSFDKYIQGYRLNTKTWEYELSAAPSDSRDVYKEFIDLIYVYGDASSLVNDTSPVDINDIQIGDIFVKAYEPGSTKLGHATIVVDEAVNDHGEKVVLLARSNIPPQQTHIIVNQMNKNISPWYSVREIKKAKKLRIPGKTYELNELRRFGEEVKDI